MNVEELHCVVSGRVQMVMFRDFTTRLARSLKLVGSVRNLENGTVEVAAQGPHDVLELFLVRLRRGSLFSRVDAVEVHWRQTTQTFDDFRLVR